MILKILSRILLLPCGLLLKLYELAAEGARDINNKFRFKDSIIDRKCCINSGSKIGPNCHILENTLINNCDIKSFTYIGKNSLVQNANIGSFCSIANDVFIGLGAHPSDHFSTSPLLYRINNTFRVRITKENVDFTEYVPVNISNDVWIGARAIVMDGINIGDGAIIAAGAVVTKDIPPYAIVAGIPAKIIRYRFQSEKIETILSMQWWIWPLSEIKDRLYELRGL